MGRVGTICAAVGLATGLVALGGCRSPAASAWNLRELHAFDGSTKRLGRVQTHSEFMVRRSLAGLSFFDGDGPSGPAAKPERPTHRPLDRTLSELLTLASFSADDPAVAGLQVEFFAWLGVADPYVLARERCVLELGAAGRRLGVERPVQRPEDAPAADPETVRDAVRRLWAAQERGSAGELEEILAELAELELDLEGSRRVLAALNLAVARPVGGAARPALLDLHCVLQERTVALALGEALMDADGLVRAAALRASASLSELAREDVLRAWADESEGFDRAPRVLHAVADLAALGVPDGGDERLWRERLYLIAETPDGPASVAACRALAALMPGAEPTLRPEEWLLRLREERALAAPEPPGDAAERALP